MHPYVTLAILREFQDEKSSSTAIILQLHTSTFLSRCPQADDFGMLRPTPKPQTSHMKHARSLMHMPKPALQYQRINLSQHNGCQVILSVDHNAAGYCCKRPVPCHGHVSCRTTLFCPKRDCNTLARASPSTLIGICDDTVCVEDVLAPAEDGMFSSFCLPGLVGCQSTGLEAEGRMSVLLLSFVSWKESLLRFPSQPHHQR